MRIPFNMSRRHFIKHLAGASALAVPASAFLSSVQAQAQQLAKNQRSAILLWLGGGASTIDMWDMKPGTPVSGPFRPMATNSEALICEHLPLLSQQMHQLSIVRSMSTREADHTRGRYFMHTGFVPNPSVAHPSYGAVVAHQLASQRPDLEIPPFVAVGGNSVGPGFLGMTWAPFVVRSNGRVKDLSIDIPSRRLAQRMEALKTIENSFIREQRGAAAEDHAKILDKTLSLMTSQQMQAFRVSSESKATRDRYGRNGFGEGCLLARRMVEAGVPFVEVDFDGWDNHQNIFPTLKDQKLPQLDQAFSALMVDLEQRGMSENVVVICMGEFSRTPRINGNAGRDHWARAWSVVLGGAGIQGGQVVGQTNEDGTKVISDPYTSQDLMATVCKGLGISLDTSFTTRSGRPMKIANGGQVIEELIA